jgi:glycolate oxidase iron-sulfur subunit
MQTQTIVAQINAAQQQQADAVLRACVHCGLCNAVCPTYQILGDERDGPRGRIYLIKQVLEGEPASSETQQHLDRCLTCRACETICPSGVAYGKLLDIGRSVIENTVPRAHADRLKRWLLVTVIPYRARFTLVLTLARIGSKFLPTAWSQKIPRITDAPVKPDRPRSEHRRKVLMVSGCVQPVLAQEIDRAAVQVLDRLGISVVYAPTAGCCGALSFHLNYQEQGLQFMRRNIDAWIPYLDDGIEAIISTASGCGVTIKDYATLLKHDDRYRHQAERVSQATKDISEILPPDTLSSLTLKSSKNYAFQSPCTLQHGQGLNGSVETLLTKLGVNLTPVADAHQCCGSAGTYSLLQPDLSERLLLDKVKALQNNNPEEILTANIGCLLHLRPQATVPVRHWIELVNELLTKDH